jgi:hypothetical protein
MPMIDGLIACVSSLWSGEKQLRTEQERRDNRGGRFRNVCQWATWPKLEVIRYLRARARGLSIHELEDWIKSTEHIVVFEDGGTDQGNWSMKVECRLSSTTYSNELVTS